MRFQTLLSLYFLSISTIHASELLETRSVKDGPCTGAGGAPGVCVPTSECSKTGGTFISNACPNTPEDIKCCTKTKCGTGGNCRWTDTCSGTSISNQCPGPATFKCCQPGNGGGDGGGGGSDSHYPAPAFPAVGACKKKSIDAAKKIVAGNPGGVRQIYCIRDCPCSANPSSDHCCGLATDLMCSKAGGVKTESGRPIAEWVMNHRKELDLKYVIWGQKIWSASRDAVKPWSQWRAMEDRGSITANHWDHVHVSYNS